MSVALQLREHERAVVAAAEARFEEADERQPAQSEFESIDTHRALRIYSGRAWRFDTLPSKARSARAKHASPRRLAGRVDGSPVLEDADNPFLADFYNDRPGAALQAQLFFLLNRHRQLMGLRQADLFAHTTVCDYLFDRDKIFAYLNLDDNELFIYQRLYDLLSRDVPTPDLVVYLQAPTDVLIRRIRETAERSRASPAAPRTTTTYAN